MKYEILKPCPFCGSDEILVKDYDHYGIDSWYTGYGVVCMDCGAQTKTHYKTEKKAIHAWNRRVNNDKRRSD